MSKYSEYVHARFAGFDHHESCEYALFSRPFELPEFPSVDEVSEKIEEIAPRKLFANFKWHAIYGMLRHKLPYPPIVCYAIFMSIEQSYPAPSLNRERYESTVDVLRNF